MRKIPCLCLAGLLLFSAGAFAEDRTSANWPQFRGPFARGVAEGYPTPTKWNVATGENIKWKTPIPGLAHSSPIVWGDKLFVTTAVSADPNPYLKVGLYGESPVHEEKVDHDFRLLCLDKNSGKILWDKSAYKGIPKVMRHIKATHANCTPATDGKYVVAFFGSEGLYCYDFDGKQVWKREFPVLDAGPPDANELQWGFASSPIVHDGKVILFVSVRNDSFLTALDVRDGMEIWKTPRESDPCWATPTVYSPSPSQGEGRTREGEARVEDPPWRAQPNSPSPSQGEDWGEGGTHVARAQVIVNGYKRIGGYDLKTGKELWWMHGAGDIPVPTPVVANDLIYITNAHGGKSPVYAIKTTAEGDISLGDDETANSHIAWAHLNIGNYMQTPLVYTPPLPLGEGRVRAGLWEGEAPAEPKSEPGAQATGGSPSPSKGEGRGEGKSEPGAPATGGSEPRPSGSATSYLYLCRDQGIMACYDARAGKKTYRERLAEGVGWTASPVAADGKVYFTNEEGQVQVIKAGPTFEVLAKNELGDITMATPAISEGVLFFRTRANLIAVGEK